MTVGFGKVKRLAVVLTKAVLAETSGEEMKVELLGLGSYQKESRKIEEQVGSGFFFKMGDVSVYLYFIKPKWEVIQDGRNFRSEPGVGKRGIVSYVYK